MVLSGPTIKRGVVVCVFVVVVVCVHYSTHLRPVSSSTSVTNVRGKLVSRNKPFKVNIKTRDNTDKHHTIKLDAKNFKKIKKEIIFKRKTVDEKSNRGGYRKRLSIVKDIAESIHLLRAYTGDEKDKEVRYRDNVTGIGSDTKTYIEEEVTTQTINQTVNLSKKTMAKAKKIPDEVSRKAFRYRVMDSSKLPWQYDESFKNPCWYKEGQLNCLPYFFIVGMRKCGTTSLYNNILQHPEAVNPGFKEAQFFGWKTKANIRKTDDIYNYIDMFSKAAQQIQNYSETHTGNVNKLVVGDGSPSYVHFNVRWAEMPGNEGLDEPRYVILDYIHRLLPNAKIVITFRDPVDRLYSEHLFFGAKGNSHIELDSRRSQPGPELFHKKIEESLTRFKECLRDHSLRSCVYDRRLYRSESIPIGVHFVYWEELLRLFPRKQIHVIQLKDISSEATMRGLFKFLEMSPPTDEVMEKIANLGKSNIRPKAVRSIQPMWNKTRDMLYDFYEPYNKWMAKLMDDPVFLYLKS